MHIILGVLIMPLHRITSADDLLCQLIVDDPIRPELDIKFRVNDCSEIFVLLDDYSKPLSVICCRYKDRVPSSVEELGQANATPPHIAIFYTVWSYSAGSGRQLIRSVRSWLGENRSDINEYVTLSPLTDMARTFHLRNGAEVLQLNASTVNYKYA